MPNLNFLKALTTEIGVMDDERRIRLWFGEAAPISERMHDGYDEGSSGKQNTPDLFQCTENILNIHEYVVSDSKMETIVCKWQISCCRHLVVIRRRLA
jgi:hypothetical protein